MKNYCFDTENRLSFMGLGNKIANFTKENTPIVVCIGTDAVLGDSLGPTVGSMLKEKIGGKTYIFGTLDQPITAKEVDFMSEFIEKVYPNSTVLAVDAALGDKKDVGTIKIFDDGIKPGLGVKKNLSKIGDIGIIGVIDEKDKGKKMLSSVRYSSVYKMATVISDGIADFFYRFR